MDIRRPSSLPLCIFWYTPLARLVSGPHSHILSGRWSMAKFVLYAVIEEARESSFLFQLFYVLVQRFKMVAFCDTLPSGRTSKFSHSRQFSIIDMITEFQMIQPSQLVRKSNKVETVWYKIFRPSSYRCGLSATYVCHLCLKCICQSNNPRALFRRNAIIS